MAGSPISLLGIVNPNEIQSALNALIIQLNEIFNSETSEASLTVANLTVSQSLTANVSGNISLNATGTVSLSPTGALTINPTAASAIDNCTLGVTVPLAVKATTLTATGAVALSPAGANVVLSPTGSGVVTVNPATAGSLNNLIIGGTTPLAITGTTIVASTSLTVKASPPTTGTLNAVAASTSGISLAVSDNVTNSLYVSHPAGGVSFGTDSGGAIQFMTNGRSTVALTLNAAQAAIFAGAGTFAGTLTVPGVTTPLLATTGTITTGAGAQVGTLTNAPAAGNPTKWWPINDNGVTRYVPAW